MRHRRPPIRARLGTTSLAAVAAVSAVAMVAAVVATVLVTGRPDPRPAAGPVAAWGVTGADTDGDGIADGSPLAADAQLPGDTVPVEGHAARRLPPARTADGPVPDGAATPIDAVRGFVAALGRGDTAGAYRLMHPRYRAAFGTYAGFGENAPVQRLAPFAVLGSARYQSGVFRARVDGETVAIVSAYGRVVRDGTERVAVLGMVARRSTSGWLVELSGEGGSAFRRPESPGEQVTAGTPLLVWTPSEGLTEVLAVVDGEPREASVIPLADPADMTEIAADGSSAGHRQVLVGVLRADGSADVVASFVDA